MFDFIFPVLVVVLLLFVVLVAFTRRYKRCPSDRILVVYGKISGGGRGGMSAKCYHGGAAFIWPLLQDYAFLDLTPLTIDIKLEGALSLQNIRVNTPSTFTVGISTEPGVMENAAERLLGMDMKQISELARDIIFGQMRVVLATMPIEEINADRDKLIENIFSGVEVELKKVGLRLINVNIQDITDESGYIDALGKEAAARAINEARVKVAEKERDGAIGAANAERDQRVSVAEAGATAVEGENEAGITVAQSNARRRQAEAEAERTAIAAEKVKAAQALEESYKAEETAERERARREEATQYANVVVPAEIEKRKIETLAEAEAERTRRTKKGEADGLRSVMEAEAAGLEAVLSRKAAGFDHMVKAARGLPELAALLLVTEQLPNLVAEQVKAISNLKIDKVTVWEGGRGEGGKTATADFLAGLVGSLPPLHELTKNVGVELPEYLGHMQRTGGSGDGPDGGSDGGGDDGGGAGGVSGGTGGGGAKPSSGTTGGGAAGGARPRSSGREASGGSAAARRDDGEDEAEPPAAGTDEVAKAAATVAAAAKASGEAKQPAAKKEAAKEAPGEASDEAASSPLGSLAARGRVRSLLASRPEIVRQLDTNRDGRLQRKEIEQAVDAVFEWARRAGDGGALWFYADEGKPVGPATWDRLRDLVRRQPDLQVNLDRARFWLPFAAVSEAADEMRTPES
jgi:flotillin